MRQKRVMLWMQALVFESLKHVAGKRCGAVQRPLNSGSSVMRLLQ